MRSSADDMAALKDELGDLLLQVVFHARMAEEAGHFGFDDVAAAIADKMERRHPHVFGDAEIASAAAQNEAWEAHKAAEREAAGGAESVLDGVALALPALLRAAKISRRAARIGFDWPDAQAVVPKDRRGDRRDRGRARRRCPTGGAGGGGRRSALRRRQPGAQARRRTRDRAAPRHREIRAPLPRTSRCWRSERGIGRDLDALEDVVGAR